MESSISHYCRLRILIRPKIENVFICNGLMLTNTNRSKRSFNVQESFMIYLKASLLFGADQQPVGFFINSGCLSRWSLPHEKKYVNTFLPLSLFLFMSGAAIAFFFVFSFVLDYLLDFNRWLGN